MMFNTAVKETYELDYTPMENLLKSGLIDACTATCPPATRGGVGGGGVGGGGLIGADGSRRYLRQNAVGDRNSLLGNISDAGNDRGDVRARVTALSPAVTELGTDKRKLIDSVSKEYRSRCMRLACRPTEPTLYNPEWPQFSDGLKYPSIRLDYILVSEAVRREAGGVVVVGTDKSALTDTLSDHYPVYIAWRQQNIANKHTEIY